MLRRIVAALCAAPTLIALAVTPTAGAETYPITGRILATYDAAGGEAILGAPTTPKQKITISGVNGYSQRFEHGAAVWNRLGGGWAITPAMPDPRLGKVSNERDALARSGMRPGVVFRSAKLCNSTRSADLNLAGLLRDGRIIDLRTSGTASDCPDPKLPYVTGVRFRMTPTSNTATFVTRSSDRASLAAALRVIADETEPVLIHCTHGRDRTGWTVTVLLSILGADQGDIYEEYQRSSGADQAKLTAGLDEVAERYGVEDRHGMSFNGMHRYVTDGLGLDQATIDRLRARLTA